MTESQWLGTEQWWELRKLNCHFPKSEWLITKTGVSHLGLTSLAF